ncbi:MAG TPA: glycosyltransferase family 4 protein [Actinomycetes bacterium]|nr:glycosyltransferase family 4 protein [Actinomycetes bacterium]
MRVGLVCPYSFDVPGGVQSHVRDLAEELTRTGHEVSVLAPADDDEALPPYVVPAGRAVPVPYNGSVARLLFGPVSANRVRRWIREGDFDVLHVHEPTSPSLGVLACWAAIGPIVATFHMSAVRSRGLVAAGGILNTALEKVSARIAVSEYARRTLVEHLGVDAVLVPNGVDVDAFRGAKPFDDLPGTSGSRIGFLGRIDEPRKGLQVLLEALPAIVAGAPEVQLVVAGPGDVDDVRKELPAELAERVSFLGLVSDEDKARLLASLDLYIAPNTGGESFGIILLEAMSAGAPVLASDLEPFRHVLEDGRSGALFANEDPVDLARQAVALLGDAGARRALVEAADVNVVQYDWTTVAQRVVEVYETVTAGQRGVREDSRLQVFGRFTRLKDDS